MTNVNQVLVSMIRKTMSTLIASELVGVQPMSLPTSGIFSIKTPEDKFMSRIKQLETIVCATMTVFEDSWMDTFVSDNQIMKPMIWCLRQLSEYVYQGAPEVDKATIQQIEDEYYTMLVWIKQNYNEITFDLEMRGIKMTKG